MSPMDVSGVTKWKRTSHHVHSLVFTTLYREDQQFSEKQKGENVKKIFTVEPPLAATPYIYSYFTLSTAATATKACPSCQNNLSTTAS